MTGEAPSPFEIAAAELRKLGLDLTRLPGEYRVNFHNGAALKVLELDDHDPVARATARLWRTKFAAENPGTS